MSRLENKNLLHALSPKIIVKIIQTFDQRTAVVVGACWAAALMVVLLAVYSVWLAGTTKKDVTTAEAIEPALPKVVNQAPIRRDIEPLVERLKKRFPEINFTLGNDQTLTVSAADGGRFRLWLTTLSYIDTISPQYRWSIRDLCVGAKCAAGNVLMRAVLIAEKISFSAPDVENQ